MNDAPEPVVEVTVAASADTVWEALRDPVQIRRWFGWDTAGADEEIALIFLGEVPDGIDLPEAIDTSIEVDDAARSLRTGPHRIEVSDAGGRAVVRVTRGLAPGDAGWEGFVDMIDQVDEGWISFFQTLAFALARHPGEPRRTTFGMGLLPAEIPDLSSLLGLDTAELRTGARYAARLDAAGDLTGEIWFRSAHQVGLTVEGWGDGLLVVAEVPSGEAGVRPAMAIGSTYGLDDASHDALVARWDAWWAGLAPDGDA